MKAFIFAMYYSSIGVLYEGPRCIYEVVKEYLYVTNIHFILRSWMYENIYR